MALSGQNGSFAGYLSFIYPLMSLKGPILCIDDDEDDQHLIGLAIQQMKLPNSLLFFHDGQQALDFLESTTEQPFLILCDINMPLMNGLELHRRIGASEYLRRKAIPFVFLTTTGNAYSIAEAYKQSVQGFYQKAINFTDLADQLRLIVAYWQSCLHPNSYV